MDRDDIANHSDGIANHSHETRRISMRIISY
jgi:hypothetical protein